VFKFLGKLWKGKATIIGIATAALGTIGLTDAAHSVVGVSDAVSTIVISVGSILAVFGIGRKAGYAANP
jgi:hypothetical protein